MQQISGSHNATVRDDLRQVNSIQNSLQRQAIDALMNELEKSQAGTFGGLTNGASTAGKLQADQQRAQPHHETWAHVAAATTAAANMGASTPRYMTTTPMAIGPLSRPSASSALLHRATVGSNAPVAAIADSSNKPTSTATDTTTARGLSPDTSHREVALPCLPLYHPDLEPPKAGVIRVLGKIVKDFVQFMTTRIHEGPLYEIKIESVHSARVTFQYAAHALAFLKSHEDMEQMLGFGRFGQGYHVELAELVDWTDDLRKMNQPARERRRLSFARKRLFSDGMTPEKWKQDIRAVVGVGNIDFLWVFNSGNGKCMYPCTHMGCD